MKVSIRFYWWNEKVKIRCKEICQSLKTAKATSEAKEHFSIPVGSGSRTKSLSQEKHKLTEFEEL